MKFLSNENIATSLIKFLREAGHDVKDIKEEKLFELADLEIYKLADKERRQKPSHVIKILADFLHEHPKKSFEGKLIILEETGVRIET